MSRCLEIDWINVVLQDVVDFLRMNDMAETADALAASAVNVRISLEACPDAVPSFSAHKDSTVASNVVAFRAKSVSKG